MFQPLSLRADLLDPLVSLHWEKCNDLPVEIDEAHSVWLNGKLYVGGGIIYDGSHAQLLVYSPSEDSWEVIPTPTEYYALATYHSQLVLVGGYDPTTYKPTSKVWLLEDRSLVPHPTLPDMPVSTSTSRSAAVGFGDYLIVSGSEQDKGSTAMSVFDGQNWLSAQALPERLSLKSTVNGDDWYLTGRQAVYRTSLKSLVASAVSPAAAAAAQSAVWERLPDKPRERSGITWFGDHLLAVGGKNGSRKFTSIYAYNSLMKVWEHVSDFPGDGCYDNCCAVLPTGELLVIGGWRTFNGVLKATITGLYNCTCIIIITCTVNPR